MSPRAPESTASGAAAPRGARREASIDLSALARNIQNLTDALGYDQPLVDLRASAYGHGLVPVARAASAAGIDTFLVSSPADADELAHAGITATAITTPDVAAGRDLGIAVYGLLPRVDGTGPASTGPASTVTPAAVMTLSAEVIAVKRVAAGTGVSYGYTYRAADDTSIALVSIGYADGVPRLGSNTAVASLGGHQHPVVGRIAMDQLVLDIGDHDARPGDTAVLFGDEALGLPSALDWALRTRRSPADLTAGLGRRVVRTYTND